MAETLIVADARSVYDLNAFEACAARLAGRALRAETYASARLQLLREFAGVGHTPRLLLLAPTLLLRCTPVADGGGVRLSLERAAAAVLSDAPAAGCKRTRCDDA
jgi:hypothetical protein